MSITFIEYLIEAKSLNFNPEFVFANKQVFDAEMAVSPTSDEAQKIISKIQRPKIDDLAQKLEIQWTMLFAKSHEQHDRWRGTSRLVWSYILVGTDRNGNEIAYYKYEAGPGSGQSHVYGNRKNKTKLTWVLGATPAQAREALELNKPTGEEVSVPSNKEELQTLLSKKFQKTRFFDEGRSIRMTLPLKNDPYDNKRRAVTFLLKPYRNKIIVKYDVLYGAKDAKRGYNIPDPKYPYLDRYAETRDKVGSFTDTNKMIKAIRTARKESSR